LLVAVESDAATDLIELLKRNWAAKMRTKAMRPVPGTRKCLVVLILVVLDMDIPEETLGRRVFEGLLSSEDQEFLRKRAAAMKERETKVAVQKLMMLYDYVTEEEARCALESCGDLLVRLCI